MTQVFETTSVAKFNDSFMKLEDDLAFNRLFKKTANATALAACVKGTFLPGGTSALLQLENTPDSAAFFWQFAKEQYEELKEFGEDDATKSIQGSSFVIKCWNCE